MQETIPNRIVIYTKDIMNITGRKERTARKLLARIRKEFNKERGDFVTTYEFSRFTGIKEENLREFLKN
ncbi:MAG: hypothetical protein EPN37_13365 [Chitinophagaceae bacterium]|nr:MAG: hypothetical protein EPN37_13365 [Chitinophagaceae bacterium]